MEKDPFKPLKIISECPVCHERRSAPQVQFINDCPEGNLLYVQCANCASRLVVLVSFVTGGMNLLGVLTDLESNEIKKFSERGPLKADDVLELNQALGQKDFIKKLTE